MYTSCMDLSMQSGSGANYFQSITPNLSAGGEVFWLSKGNKSGTGFAARHTGKQHVATCQLATTGLASLTYVHRVSEKVLPWCSCPGLCMMR